MGTFELLAVISLVCLAFGNLAVGVVNDAVNFLNSAIGAKVASRKVILWVAAAGVMIGATFSDGIIEVARKGIFHPGFFTLEEAILIFVGVAIADIVLLDIYSTFGLPTSTTVTIVFELLGAAFLVAFWKAGGFTNAWDAINTASAVKIITSIILSVGIAFTIGMIIQFFTRLLFTFDYKSRLKSWGFLWCGVAMSILMYFILIKGGKHASFMSDDFKTMISTNTLLVLSSSFVFFSILSFVLIRLKVNILKLIILIGTGALAMAFAGNDLANFIGISVGGVHAFFGADLSGELATPTWVLLAAGLTMTVAMFTSRKAISVISTSVNLASSQKHVMKDWKPNGFSFQLTKGFSYLFDLIAKIVPSKLRSWISKRLDGGGPQEDGTDYDLIRAAVNLMVAAAIISYATSYKLPLSTTYVTFMVTMGTSLADKSWDKESAPHRITGVFTVIGGWFMTAFFAFVLAGIVATILYFFRAYGLISLLFMVGLLIHKLYRVHHKRHTRKVAAGAVTSSTLLG